MDSCVIARFPVRSRFGKFLIVGGFSTCIDFAIFYLCFSLIGIHVAVANTISYGIGLGNSFFINRVWTFADSNKREKRRVFLSLLWGYVGLMLNTAIVWGLSYVIHVYAGKVIAVAFIVVFNYIINKHIVFSVK